MFSLTTWQGTVCHFLCYEATFHLLYRLYSLDTFELGECLGESVFWNEKPTRGSGAGWELVNLT